ncbi:MAG: hypothetical protein NT085_02655 [candidate division SR1 bacterium]|nr:hypothetical protein [candidate division SR1 bacterium]
MNQMSLITQLDVCQRKICLDNVSALFTENSDGSYEITLEINSNRFLIAVNNIANQIESLEIIATKGFIEISNKIILMIKRLIEYLRYRLD